MASSFSSGRTDMAGIGRLQERVLCISESEREELERISRSHSAPHSVVRRAQIVLASADGRTTLRLRTGSAPPTQRFATGISDGSNWGSSDFTEKPGQGSQKLMTKKKLRNCCVWFCGANLQTALIGRFARQHQLPVCQKAQWGAC